MAWTPAHAQTQQYMAQYTGGLFGGTGAIVYAPDYNSLCAEIVASFIPWETGQGNVDVTTQMTSTASGPPSATNVSYFCRFYESHYIQSGNHLYGPFTGNPSEQITAVACGGSRQIACAFSTPQKAAAPSCSKGCPSGSTSSDSGAADAGSGGTVKGNSVDVANANANQAEADYVGAGSNPIRFARSYESVSAYQAYSNGQTASGQPLLGAAAWSASYFQYLQPNGSGHVTASRPDGRVLVFGTSSSGVYTDADVADRLVQTSSGWQYHTADDTIETYNANGLLLSVAPRGLAPVTVTYASGATTPGSPPQSVSDAFGHSLQFSYQNDATGAQRLASIIDPNGQTISYSYDANGRPYLVTYADGTTRGYGYDATNKWLLVNVTDESQVQYASWTYQYAGAQVLTSQLAGGVNQYSFSSSLNGSSGSVTVTDPLGKSRTYNQSIVLGRYRTSSSTATCPGCGEDASRTYDANANVTVSTDFDGNQTKYAYDTTRNIETSRTEGLTSTGATTSQTRTITTQWDPNWRQPQQITVYAGGSATGTPLRITNFSYDGDSGVSCGGATGSLCTKTITDPSVTPNLTRTWSYTYDSFGRVLTAKGPRTDVNSTTTYTYYTCTSGSQCGQLDTVTDPVGNVTTYNTYNAHGQPLTITDPNGVVTTLTYDTRMRLTSRQIGTETTSFSYYPTGLLKQVTLPDSSHVLYTYDNAHRLTKISDGASNSIQYTLDNMGNRTAEKTYDPSSVLHRTHTRAFNTLNQLYQDINAANTSAVTTTYSYDSQGNQTTIAAPLSRNTTNAYDQLNRLNQITDPNTGNTYFGYDPQNNLTSVEDPKGPTTTYGYDGFGDVTSQVSPDTGTTSNTYDSGGNLSTSTDARSAVSTYGYDAANRVTSVVYSSGGVSDQTITFGYDAGTNGKGRLTSASDANHSLSFSYDFAGRVTGKGLTVGSVNVSVGYGYTNGDRTALVTPSGQSVVYAFNGNHQIASITVNGTTVLSGVTYEPFAGVSGWTWGDGTTTTRTFNGDGLVSQIVTAGVTLGYSYDNANRITGISDSSNSTLSWSYGYDLLDRLTSATTSAITDGWTYDANGNQLTQTGTTPVTFAVSATSNQLSSTSGSLVRSYIYDAAGHTEANTVNTFGYNDRGRMVVSNGSTSYLYNALGQMIVKSGTLGTTLFMQDEFGHLIGEYDGGGNLIEETIWMGDIPVATIQPNGSGGVNIYYVHTDHLNSPRKVQQPVTDQLVWRWDSDPFGTAAPNQNPTGLGTFSYNLRFPGQYHMAETGLNQNWNRDYDPLTGKYVESDPIGLNGGINTYRYVADNPISYIDWFGLLLCPVTLPGIGHTYLDDSFIPLVQAWIDLSQHAGIDLNFTEAFRTSAYQAALAGNPNATTPAAPGNSLHEAGYAVDISWNRLTAVQQDQVLDFADTAGLDWGGDFKRPDPVHFYHDPGNRKDKIRDAQARYKKGANCGCN
jgi:RHS repeat-associated protein